MTKLRHPHIRAVRVLKSLGAIYQVVNGIAVSDKKKPKPSCSSSPAGKRVQAIHSKETIKFVQALKGRMSASEIAECLGLSSRNVVIGIWHRNG